MLDTNDTTRIAQYVAGEDQDPAARAAHAKWIAGDPERQAFAEQLERVMRTSPAALPPSPVGAALDRLWASMAEERVVGGGAPKLVHWDVRRWSGWAASLAAVLVVGVAGYVAQRASVGGEAHSYVSGRGERTTVRLADGTEIVLAPDSRLRVSGSYAAGDRLVMLDGEGYFRVRHDRRHPFAVRAHDVTITDIGTEFDVRDYAADPNVRIAVASGQVAVGAASLYPGDVAMVDGRGTSVMRHADLAALTAWIQGRLVFSDTPLSDVVRDVARAYDLDVTVSDTPLAHYRVTGQFGSEPVDEVLDNIALSIGAHVERRGRHVTFVPGAGTVVQPLHGTRPAGTRLVDAKSGGSDEP